jgi:putative DNA primase/helicase
MHVSEFLSRLDSPRKNSHGWQARCPAHDDRQASLSVCEGRDGRILLKCFAGCAAPDIVTALSLSMKDLFPAPPPGREQRRRRTPAGPPLTVAALAEDKCLPADFLRSLGLRDDPRYGVVIPYRDECGATFRERRRSALKAGDGSSWAPGEGVIAYGLDRLAAARAAGSLTLVEGESDCWTLWHFGCPALGAPGATMTKTLSPDFLGGIPLVYIVQEPDAAGAQFAAEVARHICSGWIGEVRIVRLDGVKDPNDLLQKTGPAGFAAAWQAALAAATPPGPPAPAIAPLTDAGNAERFAAQHRQEARYVPAWRAWLTWDGRRWKRDEQAVHVRAMAKQTVRRIDEETRAAASKEERAALWKHAMRSESAQRLDSMLRVTEAEAEMQLDPEDLDADPFLLNVQNGILDLRTGELAPHDPARRLSQLAGAAFDPYARRPLWDDFLDRIFAGDRALIDYVQRFLGYGLSGEVREHVLAIFYGTGANGKSVLLETVKGVFGGYARQTAPGLLLDQHHEAHPTATADLYRTRLAVATEIDHGDRLSEALVKQLTGGDEISTRRMHENFWTFRPTHKFVMATNHTPMVSGQDEGLWRRLRLVPFNVTIPDAERDKLLTEKLRAERSGILNWLVEGCLLWQRQGLADSAAVKSATGEYQEEFDRLADFLSECCDRGADCRAPAKALFNAYAAYSDRQGVKHPMSNTAFGRCLTERGFHKVKRNDGYHRVGLALKSRADD